MPTVGILPECCIKTSQAPDRTAQDGESSLLSEAGKCVPDTPIPGPLLKSSGSSRLTLQPEERHVMMH